MYKVSIDVLKAFKNALEQSNSVLRGQLNGENDEAIELAIAANEKEIKIITESFYID